MCSTTLSSSLSTKMLTRACRAGLLILLALILSSISSVMARTKYGTMLMRATAADSNSALVGYELEMMHVDHHDAPRRSPAALAHGMQTPVRSSSRGTTLKERYEGAAGRSIAKAKSLHRQLVAQQLQLQSSAARAPARTGQTAATPTPVAAPAAAATSAVFSQQGEYVMYLRIGTPAKEYTTIVDTGSDLVWVQCRPCPDCFKQPDPLFDPSKSTSYRRVNCTSHLCSSLFLSSCQNNACTYNYGYGDGSYTDGNLSIETITLTTTRKTTVEVPNFAFGCGTSDAGDFSGSDGLVGLGNGSLSMMTQLAPKLGNVFSYCLVTFESAITTTSPLIVGSVLSPDESKNLSYTPLIHNRLNPSFYYVQLEDLSVEGKKLNVSKNAFSIDRFGNGGTIMDSGTTLYFLSSQAFNPLKAALQPLISYPPVDASVIGFALCYNVTGVEEPVFPTITIHFTGADWILPQENAFVLIDDDGTTCLTAIPTNQFSIIGNLLQQNFLFVYDRANAVMGFAPKQCDRL